MIVIELYGSWPANVMSLVRDPALYLNTWERESPYNVGWEEVWRKQRSVCRVYVGIHWLKTTTREHIANIGS